MHLHLELVLGEDDGEHLLDGRDVGGRVAAVSSPGADEEENEEENGRPHCDIDCVCQTGLKMGGGGEGLLPPPLLLSQCYSWQWRSIKPSQRR